MSWTGTSNSCASAPIQLKIASPAITLHKKFIKHARKASLKIINISVIQAPGKVLLTYCNYYCLDSAAITNSACHYAGK